MALKLEFFRKNYRAVLTISALLLLVISIVVHLQADYSFYRLLRAVSCFTFLGFLFLFKGKNTPTLMALFLMLYGASSVLTIWYENSSAAILALALNFIAYMCLIVAVAPNASFKKMNGYFIALFLILVLFCGYLLVEFIRMINESNLNSTVYFLMLLIALTLVALAFLSLTYNYNYSTKPSMIFTGFVFVLIFSEVFRVSGYYDFALGDIAVYISRGLFLIAMSLLVHFVMQDKKVEEQLSSGTLI